MTDINTWGPADWLAVCFVAVILLEMIVKPVVAWLFGLACIAAERVYRLGKGGDQS